MRGGRWRWVLAPLAGLYYLGLVIHRGLYRLGLRRQRHLGAPTISIGNLAAGGTGKSPMTIEVARLLLGAGARPAILTRGYGVALRRGEALVLLNGALLSAHRRTDAKGDGPLPDEARMESVALPTVPVVVGPDRYAAAQYYLQSCQGRGVPPPTHWLLEDGMQHWPLARDLEVVLLDAATPLPALLPVGLGREPAAALARADLIIYTRGGDGLPTAAAAAAVRRWAPSVPTQVVRFITALPPAPMLEAPPGQEPAAGPYILVTGIAQPSSLRASLRALGVPLGAVLAYGDHRPLDPAQLRTASAGSRGILTTAKDYWRDPAVFAGLPAAVLVLSLSVDWDKGKLSALIKRLG